MICIPASDANKGAAMTKKAEFNAEEWSTIAEGPLLAGARVIKADKGGTIRESLALGKVYAQAREAQGDSELLDELVSTPPALDRNRLQGTDIATLATEGLREAVRILEEKATPEELAAYRSFVLSAAQAAANAHKEGGVLGIGGTRVSDAEQAALDEIAATLGGDTA
jgi:hypothetical protein